MNLESKFVWILQTQIRLLNWKYLMWSAHIEYVYLWVKLWKGVWSINVRFRFRVIDITVSDTKARIPRRMRAYIVHPRRSFLATSKGIIDKQLASQWRWSRLEHVCTCIATRSAMCIKISNVCRSGHDRHASQIRIFTARYSSRYYIKRFLRLSSVGSEYLRWAI